MIRFRKTIFWIHLTLGVSMGVVIFVLAGTGLILSFESQWINLIERRWAAELKHLPPSSQLLTLSEKAVIAVTKEPHKKLTGLVVERDSNAVVTFQFGRESMVWVDAYGRVMNRVSEVKQFFAEVEEIHRYLGSKEKGRWLTGLSNLLFSFLIVLGLVLWWPTKQRQNQFRKQLIFIKTETSKARDYHWHQVLGFWSATILLIISLSGIVLSYQWANQLVYRLTGSPLPEATSSQGPKGLGKADKPQSISYLSVGKLQIQHYDYYLEQLTKVAPMWVTATIRIPQKPGDAIILQVQEKDQNKFERSRLVLTASTGQIELWQPYSEFSQGRKLRAFIRGIHTGEWYGWPGQLVAAIATICALILVWTGLALTFRRIKQWFRTR